MQKIVVLGAGGDALVIAEAISQARQAGQGIECVGFLDDRLKGQIVQGQPVLGGLDDWSRLDPNIRYVSAIQKVKDAPRRVERLLGLSIPDERWISVMHPQSAIADDTKIGRGVFIASFVTVQPRCEIGDFASLRAGAMLGHDCTVCAHAYVGPNAVMCGGSALGTGAHLGPAAVLLDGKTMGDYSVAGISSAVTKHVKDRTIVFGNPARRIGFVR